MDMHEDLVRWVRKMGYNGSIPENLSCICNNSTRLLWEDLMQNCCPKQEVERIRRDIILHRLNSKSLDEQDHFPYKNKEIELYKQKQQLELRLKTLKSNIREKKLLLEGLTNKCLLKDVSVKVLDEKIDEREQRRFLLDCKQEQVLLQISQVEDMLVKFKNVTPIEWGDDSNSQNINGILEHCAAKLEKMILEEQVLKWEKLPKAPADVSQSTRKVSKHESSIAMFLSVRERENFDEITHSCRKQRQPPSKTIPKTHNKVKQRLFDTSKVIIQNSDKTISDCDTSCFHILSTLSETSVTPERNNDTSKSESLGLLPDNFLEDLKEDQSFLSSYASSQILENVFTPSVAVTSERFSFKVPRTLPKKSESNKTKLYKNSSVNKPLGELLHSNNRELIFQVLEKQKESLKGKFLELLIQDSQADENVAKVTDEDVTKLHHVHVETALNIVKQKGELKELVMKIGQKKMRLLTSIELKSNRIELEEWLEAYLSQIALDSSIVAIKKQLREVNASKSQHSDDNDLNVLASKKLKIKTEIANKMKLIQWVVEMLRESHETIAVTREAVQNCLWQLRALTLNTDWMNPLLGNIASVELQIFQKFPLNFYRRCSHTNPEMFYRDLCSGNLPDVSEISSKDLQMLIEILRSPLKPPEVLLLDFLKSKRMLECLRNIKQRQHKSFLPENFRKYSLEDLKMQESYLDYAVDKLKSLMLSSSATKTLGVGDWVKQTMEIWSEMPFKDLISVKREVEGHGFQYYKKRLARFL
ncbi:putative leucine-rich repeat-containing protein DDB_G0290503 [Euwallacea similis]|uniref:putative leucine-rich repeat-containing protein DDB_G0290503 n=1 Tax=Euwallacea similis TaxID=1736056 RepID=UPI00344E370F